LKQEDFSAAGRLMRTSLIPRYSRIAATRGGEKYVATQILIRDELNPGEQTQQILSDVSFSKLPDMVFTKAYLENLN
jgi:hypothetical protein